MISDSDDEDDRYAALSAAAGTSSAPGPSSGSSRGWTKAARNRPEPDATSDAKVDMHGTSARYMEIRWVENWIKGKIQLIAAKESLLTFSGVS